MVSVHIFLSLVIVATISSRTCPLNPFSSKICGFPDDFCGDQMLLVLGVLP